MAEKEKTAKNVNQKFFRLGKIIGAPTFVKSARVRKIFFPILF